MKLKRSTGDDTYTVNGVLFLIIAVILGIIALVLWLNDFDWIKVTALLGFALFIVACGIQSIINGSVVVRQRQNPISLFMGNKTPLLLGLIPLTYAIGAALTFAPPKIRAFIILFILLAGLVFSFLRDVFKARKPEEGPNRMDKFYAKTAEAEEALGLERGIGGEDIATRKVTMRRKYQLLGGMLRFAPWQLIAAFILAIAFMLTVDFWT